MESLLDNIMRVEKEKENRVGMPPAPSKAEYDRTPVKLLCDKCKREFWGAQWMVHALKEIICNNCHKESKNKSL